MRALEIGAQKRTGRSERIPQRYQWPSWAAGASCVPPRCACGKPRRPCWWRGDVRQPTHARCDARRRTRTIIRCCAPSPTI